MDDDDVLHLLDDEPAPDIVHAQRAWTIAVVDDDPAVHEGTRFALYDYTLHGQGLRILSAYSAEEGRRLLATERDIAVVFLDVVMETDDAGLELVDFIRKQLKNETVRIVLRTGQPGQAPERRVIIDYDINDYKAKTELTADKLFTTLTAALRGYQQLQRLTETRRGLELIIEAASTFFDFQSMQRLAEGVLTQIASLLNVECAGILVVRDGDNADDRFAVLAGSGCYRDMVGTAAQQLVPSMREQLIAAFERRRHAFLDQHSVLYLRTGSGREIVVLLEADKQLSETDRELIELFTSRLSVAFDNVILYEQLQEANARLEERVFQRTSELYRANQRLAAQRGTLRRANRFKSEML
jgi:CheY-like chemotaxis protein